jgi:hypothetical protein
MTWDKRILKDYQDCVANRRIGFPDGTSVDIKGYGTVELVVNIGGRKVIRTLKNVQYAPKLHYQLVSEGKAQERGFSITKTTDGLCRINNGNEIVLEGRKQASGLTTVNLWDESAMAAMPRSEPESLQEWHAKLCHFRKSALLKMSKDAAYGIRVRSDKAVDCESCQISKFTRNPQPKRSVRNVKHQGEVITSNFKGPITPTSKGGAKYVCLFTDVATRETHAFLMSSKGGSETLQTFKNFKASFELKYGVKIKSLRTDNGGEYTSDNFEEYLRQQGIRHEKTAPYSSAQNGIVERKHRTIFDAVRSCLKESGLPKYLWGECLMNVVEVQNKLPTRVLNDISPYEKIHGKKPYLGNIQKFGQVCYIRNEKASNLDDKARKCYYLGHSNTTKGSSFREIIVSVLPKKLWNWTISRE